MPIPRDTRTLEIAQTTACITPVTATPSASPTGVNPILTPNDANSNVRAGRATNITWIPTTSGTVSIICQPIRENQNDGRTATTVASKISNSGSYSWTPESNLASPPADGDEYFITIVDDSNTSPSQMSNSTEIYLRPAGYAMTFIIAPGNPPPVLGQPFNIMWDASNASSISLTIFGGDTQGPDVNVAIADHVPNTGSFLWNVPTNQPPIQAGYWTLSIFNDDTGNKDSTREFVINAQPASTCVPATSPTGLPPLPGFVTPTFPPPSVIGSTTTSSSPILAQTSYPAYLPGPYARALEITSCAAASSIEPAFTFLVNNGTITSFVTVGCPPASSSAAPGAFPTPTSEICKPDFQTFALTPPATSAGVCCPSDWGTSTLGGTGLYCYTTTTSPSTQTVSNMKAKRNSQLFSTVVLYNVVFAEAGTVSGSVSSTPVTAAPSVTAGGVSAAAAASSPTSTSTKSGAAGGRFVDSRNSVFWRVKMIAVVAVVVYMV